MLRKLFSSILLIAAVVIGFGAFGHASEARQLHDAIGPFLISPHVAGAIDVAFGTSSVDACWSSP
ncbi:MAG: hypothetical protein WB795_16625 [Candidatus Acidiferrales bacterium]